MLNTIVKLVPLGGALLIFCGIMRLIFYYSHFNINVTEFLEFQEIITSFLNDINTILIFGMMMTVISVVSINFLRRKSNLNPDDHLKRLLSFSFLHRFKYCSFFLLTILIELTLINYDIAKYSYFIIYLLTFETVQMLSFFFLSKNEDGEIIMPDIFWLIIIGVSLSLSIYLLSKRNIQNTYTNDIEVIVEWKNEIIKCNKQTKNLFIGKTNNYVFIQIDSTNSTFVIPSDEVTKFEFR